MVKIPGANLTLGSVVLLLDIYLKAMFTWYHNQCLKFELFISSHPTRGGHSSTLSKTAKTGCLESLTVNY